MAAAETIPTPDLQTRLREGASTAWSKMHTVRVVLAAALAFGVFELLGRLVGVPAAGPSEFADASLIHQPIVLAALFAVGFGLLVATIFNTLIAGGVRYDAGWAAALTGLLALRWRGGDSYYSLDGRGPGVFVGFLVELVILTLLAYGLWLAVHRLRERGAERAAIKRFLELPTPDARLLDRRLAQQPMSQRLLALLISTGVCVVVTSVICRTGNEAQVAAAVAAGGWAGAAAAHAVVPTRPAPWFFLGPVLAGCVGYLLAFFSGSSDALAVGDPGGVLPALARPLPLDWLAAGVPASLYGYVRSRTKQLGEVAEARQKHDATRA
jgi:hypothetical protein